MKNLIPLFAIMAVAILFLSCKRILNQNAVVVRDCTGTYLRFDGKDYQVCNIDKVEAFHDGAMVNATFNNIKQCNCYTKDEAICKLLHHKEGWIEVKIIR